MKHPAFRNQYSVNVSADVFVIASEVDTRFLTGHIAGCVIPLLNGQLTVEEIVQKLADRVPGPAVLEFIGSLDNSGLLMDGTPSSRAEGAFWEYAGADPGQAANRREAADVEIVPIAGAVTAGIGEALAALGVQECSNGPFRLVVTADYTDRSLEKINRASLERATPWMLVRPFGRVQWLGPIFVPGQTACWQCLAHRLEVNGWLSQTAIANLPTTAAVTRTLAATEAAKWLLTGSNVLLKGRIRSFDTVTLQFGDHPVMPLPQCPACGGKLRQKSRPEIDTLVSPVTGLVQEVTDAFVDAGISIAEATATRVLWPDAAGTLHYCRPDVALGKGRTSVAARRACLWEAIERYSCRFHGDERRITSSLGKLGDAAVNPSNMLLYSEAQYRNREAWNRENGDFHRIGEPFDPDASVEWTPVVEWSSGTVRYVPTGYCFMGYEVQFCGANSNGCATGESFEQAVMQGLLELVERDAVALWWYNRAARPKVGIDLIRSPRVAAVLETIRQRGRTVDVLDLTTDFAIPVCVAISAREDGSHIVLGSGAAHDLESAAWRALAEAVCLMLADGPIASAPANHEEHALRHWLDIAALENQPWLLSNTTSGLRRQEAGDARECTARIERNGLQVLVLDVTRPEIGMPAVRVIVPGLRPWWARFAPGRLYDTPVALGWRNAPLSETELNPIPFFL
jgi:ribosomal protein S12 methylthiotransferase accessory factor